MKGKILYLTAKEAWDFLKDKHYAGRKPQISKAFGWEIDEKLVAVCTFGKPASPTLCTGICGEEHSQSVYELNRLCRVDDLKEPLEKKSDDWNGKFTEEGYYNEFIKALELKENAGRAHKDILHDLVKNDGTAFKGVTPVRLAGGTPQGNGTKYTSKADIMAIKNRTERRNAIAQNLELFGKGE